MPKEVIYGNVVPYKWESADGTVGGEVQVRLQAQIHTGEHEGGSLMIGVHGHPIDPPDEFDMEAFQVNFGQFMALDWQGANQLLRELKRGRDRAFGRPE